MFSSYFVSVFGLSITVIGLKWLTNVLIGWLQAFPLYGGLGISAPSLHRESTDSLILVYSGIPLIWASLGQKKVLRCPYFTLEIIKCVYLGWQKVSCLLRWPHFMGVLIEGFSTAVPECVEHLCTTYTYHYNRVMYIDGRHGQTIIFGQLVETMDTSDTLLHHASHVLGSTRAAYMILTHSVYVYIPPILKVSMMWDITILCTRVHAVSTQLFTHADFELPVQHCMHGHSTQLAH